MVSVEDLGDVGNIDDYKVTVLTKDVAQEHINEITQLLSQIPLVKITSSEILSDNTKRVLHGKWEHSLVVLDKQKIIAIVMAYERESEDNQQYPVNTIYISELAVDAGYQHQGIAKRLLALFLKHSYRIGFQHLTGKINFTVQTNTADWNKHVQNLYIGLGFEKRSEKVYDNRADTIYGLERVANL